jgi:hypothetical protein
VTVPVPTPVGPVQSNFPVVGFIAIEPHCDQAVEQSSASAPMITIAFFVMETSECFRFFSGISQHVRYWT